MQTMAEQVTRYLQHGKFTGGKPANCVCPPESFAPCGGQYEGRYAEHCGCRRVELQYHFPTVCRQGDAHV